MTVTYTCDICKSGRVQHGGSRTRGTTVHRYQLRRYLPAIAGTGRGVFESAGSLDMCDSCWMDIAEPRMMPSKKPKRCR